MTTRELSDEHLRTIGRLSSAGTIGNYLHGKGTVDPAAELMSLGSITTANSITFDGGRVVLDTDRLFTQTADGGAGGEQMGIDEINKNLVIRTDDADNVVLGYTAYKSDAPNEVGAFTPDGKSFTNIYVDGNKLTGGVSRYMWVEDFYQLQAMGNYTNGWFALRNAIDANYTAELNKGEGFDPIDNFTGRFDGLDYHIFGLTINRASDSDVGLFGSVGGGAIIRNVTLNGGSITGGDNVGSIAGKVSGNALVENITNTADIEGKENVGGIIGSLDGTNSTLNVHNFVNTGSVSGTSNVGGIVGEASNVTLDGRIYNLGAVTATDNNAGGIVGHALNTTIGNEITSTTPDAFQIYNQLGVTGGWNVGGIAGFIEGDSTITNVANYGDVTATDSDTEDYVYHIWDGSAFNNDTKYVNIANAGGIAGKAHGTNASSKVIIENVENHGDVTTAQDTLNDDAKTQYYIAGNVGGIVGRAQYTDITNAENTENLIAGAHNVGGIAGYFTDGTIDTAGNNGGEITATGARSANGEFAQETVNYETIWSGTETVNIGNIGGIVGYLYGANAYIRNAANRGDVHSAYIDEDATAVPETAEAANVGGIAGKVSMLRENDENLLTYLKRGQYNLATISNSYNTGNVAGYTGVGGIAGQTVRGSVAGSYNLGTVRSTRISDPGTVQPVNMGGVVGDTTVATDGSGTVIYDVYNAGEIGDDTYTYLGRHVGGVVGRLGGTLEKAYNTGDIYNGYSVMGGVVGYWVSGNIKNVFNTGNVTVVNYDLRARNSLVGGIVGAALSTNSKTLSYAYNLGTLRSFIPADADKVPYHVKDGRVVVDDPAYETVLKEIFGNDLNYSEDAAVRAQNINVVGGIIGGVTETSDGTVTVNNVYTTGNIYAGRADVNGGYEEVTESNDSNPDRIGAIWGTAYTNGGNNVSLEKAYFIKPLETGEEGDAEYTKPTTYNELDDDHIIAWENRMDKDSYSDFIIADGVAGDPDKDGWRMYDKDSNNYGMETLPMLNAFTPNSAKDQSWQTGVEGIGSVQYGTAANPLLTIINAEKNTDGTYKDVELNWSTLGISGTGSLAVYDGNLTINGFSTTLGSYFNGIIFSDGDLKVNAGGGGAHNFGSGSRLYGQNVVIDAGENDTTLYGSVTSTNGDISVSGNNVSVIGELTAKGEGETTQVEGIARNGNAADTGGETIKQSDLTNPNAKISTVERAYSHTTGAAGKDGSITVTADKNAEVLYGNMGHGRIDAAKDFTVKGKESVYIDSDLHIGGDLNLKSDGEIVLDLSNMGSYDSVNEKGETITGKENLHRNFLDHFKNAGAINVSGEGADRFMIALDMWDDGKGAFDLDKYDVTKGDYDDADNHELAADIKELKIRLNGEALDDYGAQDHTYIWIDGAEQLKGIQAYKDAKDEAKDETNILSYNFALKGDIDATNLEDYAGIASNVNIDGSKEEFSGTFDGRGFRVIGLNANADSDNDDSTTKKQTDAGIFGTIGDGGTVKDLGIYSSHFTGEDTAGAVAGVNKGTITGVTTFGNTIRVTGAEASTSIPSVTDSNVSLLAGAAGGIAGVNGGTINNVNVSDTVIASEGTGTSTDSANVTVAGGVAGINKTGGWVGALAIGTNLPSPGVVSTSAVITDVDVDNARLTHGLGGVVGINDENGYLWNVAALGATNGSYGMVDGGASEYVGGIAGANFSALVNLLYNESAVIGSSNVGGIAGINIGNLQYATNAGNVTALVGMIDVASEGTGSYSYAGGLAGSNYGGIYNGRNTGTVTGVNYVGGMVGLNASGATLSNLSNAIAAEISGVQYVGGIAGSNAGSISGSDGLVNEGSITGNRFVGGVAGLNSGTIENVNNNIVLNAVTMTGEDGEDNTPELFGGVTGDNYGTITNATNTGNIIAKGASFVGGITGVNREGATLKDAGNSGTVTGGSQVGGVAGVNDSSILDGTIENSGTVTATNGGAAGIFYANTENADINCVTLINSGVVIDSSTNEEDTEHRSGGIIGHNYAAITDSELINTSTGQVEGTNDTGSLIGINESTGVITNSTLTNYGTVSGAENTGGLIGENAASITDSTLTNYGIVKGQDNTGGLIGHNSGNISTSNLANTYNAMVTGDDNTGGLIGYNTGDIAGGRNDADTMYVYKVYNNGHVSGANSVGGIIGNNAVDAANSKTGSLTAAYNTGTVSATGENAGGVAGMNAGTIDNVFSTLMTEDGTNLTVTGASNVGGLVGHNSGTLKDAYSTTAVSGSGETGKGNAVGTNDGTITNVYASNADGKLIGANNKPGTTSNVYTFAEGDDSATLISGEEQLQSGNYEGFNFGSVWKNYDGWTAPMLKVFLTKAHITADGGVAAADGLEAYNGNNWLIGINVFNDGSLMYREFYSHQIAAGAHGGMFYPNWLGYDFDNTLYVMPELNNGYIHSDGWDRMRNFRERKAELHFVQGGMEYEEGM